VQKVGTNQSSEFSFEFAMFNDIGLDQFLASLETRYSEGITTRQIAESGTEGDE